MKPLVLVLTVFLGMSVYSANIEVKSSESGDFYKLKKSYMNSAGSACVQMKMKKFTASKSQAELKALGMGMMQKAMEFGKECACSPSSLRARKNLKSVLSKHPEWKSAKNVVYKKGSKTDSLSMRGVDKLLSLKCE